MAKNGNPVVLRCGSQLPQLQIAKKRGKKGKKKGTKEKGTRLYQLGLKNLILLVFNNMIVSGP